MCFSYDLMNQSIAHHSGCSVPKYLSKLCSYSQFSKEGENDRETWLFKFQWVPPPLT